MPAAGVAPEKEPLVLLNLHGGGFTMGARTNGQLESIPIAGLGKYRVIAIDYRQGPEHRFPAASEDVATVYRELLKTYRPEHIGLFGCSEALPTPGAVGGVRDVSHPVRHGVPDQELVKFAIDVAGRARERESVGEDRPELGFDSRIVRLAGIGRDAGRASGVRLEQLELLDLQISSVHLLERRYR